MSPTRTRWLRLLCAGALALTSLLAHAQYSWIDEKGMRVFSDRPPPPGTPAARILKTPRGLEPAPAPAPAGAVETPDWQARDADYRKRMAQREADADKAAQDASENAAKSENCKLAREVERSMSSGMRVTRIDEKGEKVFLTEEERTQRLQAARKALQSCR